MPQTEPCRRLPLRALAPCPQHRNSRVCRNDAKRMQTVWRSSTGVSARPQCCCPESASRRTVPVLSGTRNRKWRLPALPDDELAAAARKQLPDHVGSLSALLTAAMRQELSGASGLTGRHRP